MTDKKINIRCKKCSNEWEKPEGAKYCPYCGLWNYLEDK